MRSNGIRTRSSGGFSIACVALMALLAGCGVAPKRSDVTVESMERSESEASVAGRARWSIEGRIAVSDGADGGSGRLRWLQDGDRFRIEIQAPVSRRTWRLSGASGWAQLEGVEGGPRSGPDAESLLRAEVGWVVPVTDLVDWIRGAPRDDVAELTRDETGRPLRFEQSGWTIDYRDWFEGEPAMPRKLFAASGKHRVRLVVERWSEGVSLE